MLVFTVPAEFAAGLIALEGEPGRAWLHRLPELARRYCERWELRPDGEPLHGMVGVVLPVRGAHGDPAMLKLSWVDTWTMHEPLALSTWDGHGAVRLLRSHPGDGALLLERLDATRTLHGEPIAEAVPIAGSLLHRLSVPAPPGLRTLGEQAARWAAELPVEWSALGGPLPRRLLDAAVEVCRELGPESAAYLVNEDLHYENVLRGEREPWLVIDPKVLAGDPEFATLSLVWNRMDESPVAGRITDVVAAAGLDRDRAHAWTLARAVHEWLWGVRFGQDDCVRACARISGCLAG